MYTYTCPHMSTLYAYSFEERACTHQHVCICTYLCIYGRMDMHDVGMYACLCACMYVCTHVCMYVCMYVRMCVCMHARTHARTRMHALMQAGRHGWIDLRRMAASSMH